MIHNFSGENIVKLCQKRCDYSEVELCEQKWDGRGGGGWLQTDAPMHIK